MEKRPFSACEAMVQHAYDMISIVLHLLIAGLCRFCYSLDEEGIERLQVPLRTLVSSVSRSFLAVLERFGCILRLSHGDFDPF